ncbi:MAG: hypothetical protein HY922_16790 [Elusimicrobia bacterium]|nr:hypothetical protein [Elusimicrobiota bacterium]
MSPEEKTRPSDDILSRQVVYDGEGYTRDTIEGMLTDYQQKNSVDLKKFDELSLSYQRLSKDMTKDIGEQKSTFDYLSNILTFNQLGTNLKGLLQKVPGIRFLIPARGIKELLNEKIELAQRRVQEVGNYLDTLQADIKNLQDDVVRLDKKMISSAQNKEKAARYVLELEELRKKLEAQLGSLADPKSVEARTLQARIDEARRVIYEHGAKLRLYSNAAERISSIIKMSNNFLEIMTNLNSNMAGLYESGSEVLNELHGNLAGLASLSKAGELSVEMHNSMESLKKSVNRLATLASETSLYLTQNVDRLTAEMKMYDSETEKLVESNLAAEKEIREKRIDETIALAKKEYGPSSGG